MKAVFCSECGTALDEKGKCSNPSCVSYTHKETSSDSPRKVRTESFFKPISFAERGKRIVPDCIKPDLDEVPIKQYDIARLQTLIKGARAEGRLQITNKRVLFRSSGFSIVGPSSMQYEFSIEDIAGIEIRKESQFNFFPTLLLLLLSVIVGLIFQPVFSFVYNNDIVGTIFSILIAVASVFAFFLLRTKHIARYFAMSVLLAAMPLDISSLIQTALGAGEWVQNASSCVVLLLFVLSLLYVSFAPNLVIRILTKGGTPSVEIRRKNSIFSFQRNEYTGFSQVMPGPDTDLAIQELGSVIREVQQTGGYIEK